jgi:hypothetical protein
MEINEWKLAKRARKGEKSGWRGEDEEEETSLEKFSN